MAPDDHLKARHYVGAALFVGWIFLIGHLLLIVQQNAR